MERENFIKDLETFSPPARSVARHVKVLGFSLLGKESYPTVTQEHVAQLAAWYPDLPEDPKAQDKRRVVGSWEYTPAGVLRTVGEFDYEQPSNKQHSGKRGIKPMKEPMLSHPVVVATRDFLVEVGRLYKPELFEKSVRINVHAVRYLAKGCMASFASPPFDHRDTEDLAAVTQIAKDGDGGQNYVAIGAKECNVGFILEEPLDGFIVAGDVLHGVCPMVANGGKMATRDILIATAQPFAASA